MTTKYSMEISFTPLCTSCGGELEIGMTATAPGQNTFHNDMTFGMKDRRVFVAACSKCFVLKGGMDSEGAEA